MRIHRFCSEAEYTEFMKGHTLVNMKDHSQTRGDASTAVGFCFFTDDPEDAKHRLSGIVDFDYCLTFETDESNLQKCVGRYPNWIKPDVRHGSVYKDEYCCRSYDNEKFKLIQASTKFRSYCPNASLLRNIMPNIFI